MYAAQKQERHTSSNAVHAAYKQQRLPGKQQRQRRRTEQQIQAAPVAACGAIAARQSSRSSCSPLQAAMQRACSVPCIMGMSAPHNVHCGKLTCFPH